nr:hypothetical transcript [Hymenolepis microstoma]
MEMKILDVFQEQDSELNTDTANTEDNTTTYFVMETKIISQLYNNEIKSNETISITPLDDSDITTIKTNGLTDDNIIEETLTILDYL